MQLALSSQVKLPRVMSRFTKMQDKFDKAPSREVPMTTRRKRDAAAVNELWHGLRTDRSLPTGLHDSRLQEALRRNGQKALPTDRRGSVFDGVRRESDVTRRGSVVSVVSEMRRGSNAAFLRDSQAGPVNNQQMQERVLAALFGNASADSVGTGAPDPSRDASRNVSPELGATGRPTKLHEWRAELAEWKLKNLDGGPGKRHGAFLGRRVQITPLSAQGPSVNVSQRTPMPPAHFVSAGSATARF
jgi:hypothetical protein